MGTDTIPTLCEPLHYYLLSFPVAFPLRKVISSCVCTDLYSAEYSMGTLCSSSEISLCTYGFFSSTLVNSIHLGLLGLSTKRPLDLPESRIPALPNSRYLAGAFIELPLFDFLSLRTSLPDAHCVENSCFMYFVCSLFSGSRVNLGLVAPS